MLLHLTYVNDQGVAFLQVEEGRFAVLPRWIWEHVKNARKDARLLLQPSPAPAGEGVGE